MATLAKEAGKSRWASLEGITRPEGVPQMARLVGSKTAVAKLPPKDGDMLVEISKCLGFRSGRTPSIAFWHPAERIRASAI